jgi:hypothetical protein
MLSFLVASNFFVLHYMSQRNSKVVFVLFLFGIFNFLLIFVSLYINSKQQIQIKCNRGGSSFVQLQLNILIAIYVVSETFVDHCI